jgi:hypothetical protein
LPIATLLHQALRRPIELGLRSLIGVMHRPAVGPTVRDGHLERLDDELGAHVVSHRPADDLAAIAIHHRREVQPAFPGADVGDVRAPQPVHSGRVEVARDKVWGGPDALHTDRRAAATATNQTRQASVAHEPLHALATDVDVVLQGQLGMHPGRPVGLQVQGVDHGDPGAQRRVGDRAR